MRSANSFAGFAFEKIGIVVAPHEAAGVLIDGVVEADISEIGHGQQAGHVGVVHKELVAETIHFVGVYLTVFGVVVDGVFHQGIVYLISQVVALLGEGRLMIDGSEHVGHLLQCGHGHEIGRHEE